MADVLTRNTVSGQIGLVPESYLKHPWFKDQLVEVSDNAKNAAPELHKPRTAAEQKAADQTKADAKDSDAVE